MIRHVLQDGSEVDSIAGIMIRTDKFEALYKMISSMGGDKDDHIISSSDRSTQADRRKEQSSLLP